MNLFHTALVCHEVLFGLQIRGDTKSELVISGQCYLQMVILDYFTRLKLHIKIINLFSDLPFLFL